MLPHAFCFFSHSHSLVEDGSPPQNVNESKFQQLNQMIIEKQVLSLANTDELCPCLQHTDMPLHPSAKKHFTCTEIRKDPKRKNLSTGAGMLNICLKIRKIPGLSLFITAKSTMKNKESTMQSLAMARGQHLNPVWALSYSGVSMPEHTQVTKQIMLASSSVKPIKTILASITR